MQREAAVELVQPLQRQRKIGYQQFALRARRLLLARDERRQIQGIRMQLDIDNRTRGEADPGAPGKIAGAEPLR